MERRIYGLENEYGVTCTLRGQRRLSPDEVARYLFRRVVSAGAAARTCSCRTAPACTSTSGPTPSTRRPSATRCTTSSSTTRRGSGSSRALVESAEQRLAEESIRGTIYLFKNNTDSAGNSYGCHENYCTNRHDDLGHYAEVLIPFFVSRQIYAGAGKVLQTARGATYSIAQRAEHIWEGVSSATTRSRPIINTRDEPHADAERYRRLHVIVGDSNMSEYTTFLKVGAAGVHAADARGPQRRAARHDAGEPDPGDPRDQPRHHVPPHRAARQRPRGQRARHPARVPRPGAALRRHARASRRSSSGRSRCGSTASPRSRTTR